MIEQISEASKISRREALATISTALAAAILSPVLGAGAHPVIAQSNAAFKAVTPAIFPTFFMSGFECSSFLWSDKKRRNLVKETQHDKYASADYKMLHDLGIGVAREGILWPMVDKKGVYDFSSINPMIAASNKQKIAPIWELCHYGYPDDLDPFSEEFVSRFAAYSKAAATYVVERTSAPYFFSPINEITFFSFCAGEWGWVAPYTKTKEDRFRLRLNLCKAAIASVKAIKEVVPSARFIHYDPLVNVVAPRDRPDQQDDAWHETYVDTFLAWDIIYGKEHPELGGSPEILDVVGANNYSFGQMEYRRHGPHQPLAPGDDRILPLCDLLMVVWARYGRPMIIGETSGMNKGRAPWLKDVMEESLAAVDRGINLQGVCLYPAVDMPDWHTGKWLHNSLADIHPVGGHLTRHLYMPYIKELRRWQKILKNGNSLNSAVQKQRVDLQDVITTSHRLKTVPDKDWQR